MKTVYVTSTGRRFVLAYLSLDEWARAKQLALLHVGCSSEYASREAELIRTAVKP